MGHAGSDDEPAYRRPAGDQRRVRPGSGAGHRETVDRRDGILTPSQVLDRYEAKRTEVIDLAAEVADLAQLGSAAGGDVARCSAGLDEAMAAAPPRSTLGAARSSTTRR